MRRLSPPLTMLATLLTYAVMAPGSAQTDAAFPVAITVDAGKPAGQLNPIWRFFGADEPNYATMKDGRKLMAGLGELKHGDVFFRAHSLMTTGDGTPAFKWGSTNMYTEDKAGKPVYHWEIVDGIIDSYLARGVRPYLQLGFMPEAMSSAPAGTPYQHSWRPGFAYELIATGWTAPPKDYRKWEELAYQWTLHNIARYGREEVKRWYFEVWNEPNSKFYWSGSAEQFYQLHDHGVAGIRRALPEARVGGPDVAGSGGPFMDGFLKHVVSGTNYADGSTGTPTDFLSFHAKGSPRFVDGHVRMGISTHLKEVDAGFAKIAAVPQLKTRPIVIGESDPEGCAACPGPQNAYRNGTMYSSYTAASFARIWQLAQRHGVTLDGAVTWAFTFEDQPWFAGYRQLATNGVDLPVMNVFRLFAKMGTQRVSASSSAEATLDDMIQQGVRGAPDVGVLATRTADGKLAILSWHYHDDDVAAPDAAVSLSLKGLGKNASAKVTQWRVDARHANAFSAWQAMGTPQSPDQKQYQTLQTASVMAPEVLAPLALKNGAGTLAYALPRQGVTLLVIE